MRFSITLDYVMEGDNPFSENRLDYMWIDRKQQKERIVLDKELLTEILFNLNDIQREIFEMLLKGYNKSDIGKLLSITYSTLNKQLKDLQIVVKQCLAM